MPFRAPSKMTKGQRVCVVEASCELYILCRRFVWRELMAVQYYERMGTQRVRDRGDCFVHPLSIPSLNV